MAAGSQINPCLLQIPLLILLFCLSTHVCRGADTISANQPITGDKTLISSGGNFKLGFFRPGKSSFYYIGIWYNKVSLQTVAWVANRDTPILDRFSTELKILDGNLVLVNGSSAPIWSTNLTASGSRAVLEDSGNLVLYNNGGEKLWQSFDFPGNTWLPGAKIGINKRRNTTQLLTSWKNEEDASIGLFSLELMPSSEYFIWWNNPSYHYWTSGTWDQQAQKFNLVPEMRLNYIYNFSYVDNENESYFTYSVINNASISRFIMDLSGQIRQLTWLPGPQQWNIFWSQPRQQCQVYRLCGPFSVCSESTDNFCDCLFGFSQNSSKDWNLSDWSGGCTRNTDLKCGAGVLNSDKDRFLQMPNMKLPDDPQSVSVGSIEECETECLNNCSCTGYTFGGSGCSIWTGSLFNVQQYTDGSGQSLYLRLAASDVPNSGKETNLAAIVGGSVGAAIAILAAVLFGVLKWRRRSSGPIKEGSLLAFGYRDLQSATKNFSEKLGGGGFGSVFKGTLPDSTVVAVKKLDSISQGEKQFRMEVSTIGTIQHVNLVRLRGFCSEGNKKLLVYDFMPNGSLEFHLFKSGSSFLDWGARYQIALGTARGLTYLHEKCRDCIIHCDIKPENILLDAELCPKVADFGLAKLLGREFSRVLTTMRGTRGYLAPEWISGVAITTKADVYSYGMMLFEFISGRRNSEQSENGKISFFPTWAANKMIQGDNILELLDPKLSGKADVDELVRLCRVACWCIQDEESDRPSMGQVVQILEGVLDVNVPRIPRALQIFDENDQENIVFFTESSSSGQSSSQTRSNVSSASSQGKSSTSTHSSNT